MTTNSTSQHTTYHTVHELPGTKTSAMLTARPSPYPFPFPNGQFCVMSWKNQYQQIEIYISTLGNATPTSCARLLLFTKRARATHTHTHALHAHSHTPAPNSLRRTHTQIGIKKKMHSFPVDCKLCTHLHLVKIASAQLESWAEHGLPTQLLNFKPKEFKKKCTCP